MQNKIPIEEVTFLPELKQSALPGSSLRFIIKYILYSSDLEIYYDYKIYARAQAFDFLHYKGEYYLVATNVERPKLKPAQELSKFKIYAVNTNKEYSTTSWPLEIKEKYIDVVSIYTYIAPRSIFKMGNEAALARFRERITARKQPSYYTKMGALPLSIPHTEYKLTT